MLIGMIALSDIRRVGFSLLLPEKLLNFPRYYCPPEIFLGSGQRPRQFKERWFHAIRFTRVVALTGFEPECHLLGLFAGSIIIFTSHCRSLVSRVRPARGGGKVFRSSADQLFVQMVNDLAVLIYQLSRVDFGLNLKP